MLTATAHRMNTSGSRSAWLATAFVSLTAVLAAQAAPQRPSTQVGPQLHAGIASAEHRSNVPALVWLCEDYLPTLPQWPDGLDPKSSFSLSLSVAGLQIRSTNVPVPKGAVAIGTCSFANEQPEMVWRCDANGRERWFVPKDFEVPERWLHLLRAIEGDLIGTPRTLAVPVIAGHLAGGLMDGDPSAALLRIGPTLCGDATWMAFRRGEQLEVCGRSDGGLMLPMTLLAIAIADGHGELSALSLRAFAARDADQAEAARQLGRSDRDVDVATLRSLLRADDPVRLTAIESLVRHRQTAELANIIASADNDNPWATIAARDAVLRLWSIASPHDRQAARAALAQSDSPVLRDLAVSGLPREVYLARRTPTVANPSALIDAISGRARLLILLFLLSIGLLGLWLRERVALRAQAN